MLSKKINFETWKTGVLFSFRQGLTGQRQCLIALFIEGNDRWHQHYCSNDLIFGDHNRVRGSISLKTGAYEAGSGSNLSDSRCRYQTSIPNLPKWGRDMIKHNSRDSYKHGRGNLKEEQVEFELRKQTKCVSDHISSQLNHDKTMRDKEIGWITDSRCIAR